MRYQKGVPMSATLRSRSELYIQRAGKTLDSKYRWILVVDQAYGKEGETVLDSREPKTRRLPFDIEEV